MDRKEWMRQQDDEAGYPFVVTYKDRGVFPPQRYFATKDGALQEAKGDRPVEFVMERKGGKARILLPASGGL